MSSSTKIAEFGYYPCKVSFRAEDNITISCLPDYSRTIVDMKKADGIENNWIYAPVQKTRSFGGKIHKRPYSARIFGLPKTHSIKHHRADNIEHLQFHVWALSFFVGMRLTTTEAGFIDATPLKSCTLTDFILPEAQLPKAVALAERFWKMNSNKPQRTKRFAAAVHALFLAQRPQHLQYEKVTYLYTALDACFALAAALQTPTKKLRHGERIKWMCDQFNISTPIWAKANPKGESTISALRNDAFHEALLVGEPLGFAIFQDENTRNLPLEMQALICRLLVALIGADAANYVQTKVNTRQKYLLELS